MIGLWLSGAALSLLAAADPMTEIRNEAVCTAETTAPASTAGAHLAYRDLGPPDGRPVLLIGGTDQQMGQWPDTFIAALHQSGFRPILYEARDVGCSTHHVDFGPVDWGAVFTAMASGSSPSLAYDLTVLKADAAAVMDHLHIARADIVGVSGGATVAADLAATHPDRVGRLVLIMANSSNPARPMPARLERMAAMPPPPPAGADARTVAAWRTEAWRILGADASPDLNAIAWGASLRSWDPDGTARAGAALLAAGDRRAQLSTVTAPTLVIHGADDPLVSPEAGRDVADAIPGAEFMLIPDMGHDLSPAAADAAVSGLVAPAPQREPSGAS